jgi:hypothetical protein
MLGVLSSPIWADTIRRFFWYSDVMFLIVAFLSFATVIWVACSQKNSLRVKTGPMLAFVALSAWAIGLFLYTHNSIKILSVWLLATYLPIFFLLVSTYFFSSDPDATRWLYYSCTFWVFIMAAVAFLEVWLGLSHPINHLPQESLTGSVELRQGVGDYTVANGSGDTSYSGLEGIFRPTSIFLSNGKFGQALFTLVLFRWAYLYKTVKRCSWGNLATLLADILALVISGQRAAFVLLSVFAGVAVLIGVVKGEKRALRILVSATVVGLLGLSMLIVLKPGLADLVTDRYVSGFTDISERLADNLITPSATILHLYGLVGMGPGFFSLGAQKFGGVMMWQVLATGGNAESAWMRIVAELGVIGLVLYVCYHGGLILQAARRALVKSTRTHGACVFGLSWLLAIAFWGITHDTFANAFGMSIGFGLCGAAFAPLISKAATRPKRAPSAVRRPVSSISAEPVASLEYR